MGEIKDFFNYWIFGVNKNLDKIHTQECEECGELARCKKHYCFSGKNWDFTPITGDYEYYAFLCYKCYFVKKRLELEMEEEREAKKIKEKKEWREFRDEYIKECWKKQKE